MRRTNPGLPPLVLATMASQALLVVLSPTIVAIGEDLGASVGAVGQGRSIAAGVAIFGVRSDGFSHVRFAAPSRIRRDPDADIAGSS